MNQDIELPITHNFNCTICTNITSTPTKYICNNDNCKEQICDTCFLSHISTNQNCVFCRTPLNISEEDVRTHEVINTEHQSNYLNNIILRYKRRFQLVVISIFIWYVLFITYLFCTRNRSN